MLYNHSLKLELSILLWAPQGYQKLLAYQVKNQQYFLGYHYYKSHSIYDHFLLPNYYHYQQLFHHALKQLGKHLLQVDRTTQFQRHSDKGYLFLQLYINGFLFYQLNRKGLHRHKQ
nr:MAG TPA: hypothetical protein [Caudoviricetes sp.]